MKNDPSILERIWAPDFVYVEPSGHRFTKAEGIANLKASAERPTASAASSIDVRVYGGGTVAVTMAQAPPLLTAVGVYSGGETTIDVATTSGRDWAVEAGTGSDGSQEGACKRARRGNGPVPITGTFTGKVRPG